MILAVDEVSREEQLEEERQLGEEQEAQGDVSIRITCPEAKTINTTIPTRLFITTFPYRKHKSLQFAKHNSIESK